MPSRSKIARNLALASLLGNALGDLDVFLFIRFFVPMGADLMQVFSRINEIAGICFYVGGFVFSYGYLVPIDRYLNGDSSEAALARRRTLNFPAFSALLWGSLWALGGVFFFVMLDAPLAVKAYVSMSLLMGGTITAVFVYFVQDWLVRRTLVPKIFGEAQIGDVPGAYRVGIKTKMKLHFFASTVMPLTIVAGAVYMSARSFSGASDHLLFLTGLLWAWGVMIGLTFTVLLGWEVTRPILELRAAMEQVEAGQMETQLAVSSADEVGLIREGFNRMVTGLQERDLVKETFGRYVTKQVSEAVLNGQIKLGGESHEATILFCDIRDFTARSSAMSPEEIIAFLNDYFSEMVDVVMNTGGILDKFIGDGFLAVYGAPLPLPNHELCAVGAAVKMRAALKRVNEKLEQQGRAPIRTGVSIHSGRVVAGNVGSQKRMEYTVIGDTVNLASRIEGLNRQFGTDILASEFTYRKLGDAVRAEALGPVAIRGKSEPVNLYSILSLAEAEPVY